MSNRAIQTFRDLPVYKAAFELQQAIFIASKRWPKEEKYALTDQIRRSSRSVGANLSEAWAKRRYQAHFFSKLTDADAELQETLHWLHSASECGYMETVEGLTIHDILASVGRQIGAILKNPDQFCGKVQ